MGYTWTDGELITATKLNNTGGADYDFVIEWDNAEQEFVATKGTYNDVYTAMQTRTVVGLYKELTSSGQSIWSRYVPLTYAFFYSSNSTINLGGVYNDGSMTQGVSLTWYSDGTIVINS